MDLNHAGSHALVCCFFSASKQAQSPRITIMAKPPITKPYRSQSNPLSKHSPVLLVYILSRLLLFWVSMKTASALVPISPILPYKMKAPEEFRPIHRLTRLISRGC